MARSTKSEALQQVASDQKRTTYQQIVSVLNTSGTELLYVGDQRAYGEGPIVAVANAIKGQLSNNPGSEVIKSTISPFGAMIRLKGGNLMRVSVLWHNSQCQQCGAPNSDPNSWCPACMGDISTEVSADDLDALMEAFD